MNCSFAIVIQDANANGYDGWTMYVFLVGTMNNYGIANSTYRMNSATEALRSTLAKRVILREAKCQLTSRAWNLAETTLQSLVSRVEHTETSIMRLRKLKA